ncbi:WRB/Get1 family [Sphaerosporella brunnea]|uniref:WRB/Get1 family n=1 Tax=Sphaerosporella brunnea TaxID=1250544 RepID=A0A5J5ETX6_9PEZI|nr:WRB/Get1 family [Sphaerosporella brunnea]
MISLLLLVLLLTILTQLISTSMVNSLLWAIYVYIYKPPVAQQKAVRAEVLRLKKELAGTSSQDEFARWAKVRRSLDRKVAELEKLNTTLTTQRSALTTHSRSLRWLLTTGLKMFLQFWYSKQPMFWIPVGWVPRPVEWGLAFPRAPTGSVSIHVWAFACGQVVMMVLGLGTAVLVRRRVMGKGEKKVA